uniref:Uncharacterized protein n=1 Tax=Lepeophtheirus salmonis TaxID=72036 RepID=A0A0K2UB13_LEPSM
MTFGLVIHRKRFVFDASMKNKNKAKRFSELVVLEFFIFGHGTLRYKRLKISHCIYATTRIYHH